MEILMHEIVNLNNGVCLTRQTGRQAGRTGRGIRMQWNRKTLTFGCVATQQKRIVIMGLGEISPSLNSV
jgi:hypothetical protein